MSAMTYGANATNFIPREQLTQFRSSNPVSDVWSLAATFYYMITGQPPRSPKPGKDPIEVILTGGFVPIRDVRSDIPRKVAKVIDRALDDDVNGRYPDGAEFLRALNKVL
jgi:serine/threonine protein kinase